MEQKFSHGDIQKHTNICFASRMQFLGFKKWCSFFLDTKHKHVSWKNCKLRKVQCELRFVKWVRFFEQNCIMKWVIFLALRLSTRRPEINDDVHWHVWTNIKKLYLQNNVFKKRIPKMRFWFIYILVQTSFFEGLLYGTLAISFFHFWSSVNRHKKASYGSEHTGNYDAGL